MFTDELLGKIIEINASPSLSSESDEDYKLKRHMLASLLNMVGMEAEKYLATLWGQKCSHARWRKLAGILLPDASRNDGADSAKGC